MSKTSTKKLDDKLHRLTDIDTQSVDLVDRAANKRKWIVTKNEAGANITMFETIDKTGETDMTKIAKGETSNVSTETVVELLSGLTSTLTGLSDVTEQVKLFTEQHAVSVEKGETPAKATITTWGAALTTVTKSLASLFTACPALNGETVVAKTAEEIAAETAAKDAEKVAAEKALADKAVADEAVKVEAAKAADVAKAKEKIETVRKTVGEIANTLATVTAGTLTHDEVTAVVKKMDSVYISGGLMVDTYDIAALEKICNAIVTVINAEEPADLAKSATLTLAEAASRVSGISKKLETADAISDKEGKALKTVELMLTGVAKRLALVPVTATTITTEPEVKKSDLAALETRIAALVEGVVTKALEPLKAANEALKIEKAELATKLEKANSESPAARSSSAEAGGESHADESKLFPLDYNAEKHN